MEFRALGKTGVDVAELSFGAWGIGGDQWSGTDDAESLRALRRAMEMGVNFIDTALVYGDGHGEKLVGRAVKEARSGARVASKIPPKDGAWPARKGAPVEDVYPAEWVVECTERSLSNLGLGTIDLQQFHVWSDEWAHEGDWPEAVDKLRHEGKIRAFGISVNDHDPANGIELVKSGMVDTVQVIYNIFDQSPEEELFPAAEGAHVGVIVRSPLDEGGLTGMVKPGTTFPEGDWRRDYFAGDRKAQVWQRVQAIAKDLGIPVGRLPEVALRFCLSNPAVSTVAAGMRSVQNVEANVRAAQLGPLSANEVEILRHHGWARNFYV